MQYNNAFFDRPKWTKIGNIEYQVGAVIVFGFCGVLPLFGIIKELFLICNKPFIKVSMCKTVGLAEHYQCYVIDTEVDSDHVHVLSLFHLVDYSVLHTHHSFSQSDNSLYVSLKWNVEDINNGMYY